METIVINENSVLIKGLQCYMTKKFFDSFFFYEISKAKVNSINIIKKDFCPYKALVNFNDKKSKEMFLDLKNKFYPNSCVKIEVSDNIEDGDLTDINEYSSDQLFEFKVKYNQMISTKYERSAKEDGLIYKDEKVIAEQAKVLSYLIKKIGHSIIKGESIMNISLPVNIFDTRTLLQV
jgi:hypothetical protein